MGASRTAMQYTVREEYGWTGSHESRVNEPEYDMTIEDLSWKCFPFDMLDTLKSSHFDLQAFRLDASRLISAQIYANQAYENTAERLSRRESY
jgi:hypothetical protein